MQFVFNRVIQLIERYGGSEVQNKQKTKNKNPRPSRSALKHATQVSNSSCIFVCSWHGCRFLCLFFSLVFLHHVYILILFLLFLQEIAGVLVSVLAVQTKAKQKNKQNWGNIRVARFRIRPNQTPCTHIVD